MPPNKANMLLEIVRNRFRMTGRKSDKDTMVAVHCTACPPKSNQLMIV
jgi:hypothetical protein